MHYAPRPQPRNYGIFGQLSVGASHNYGREPLSRIMRAFEFLASGQRPILPRSQAPLLFYFPNLAESAFYLPELYPELSRVEHVLQPLFGSIRQEYLNSVQDNDLIAYEDQVTQVRRLRAETGGEGVLLPRDKWGTYSLRLGGKPVDPAMARCPFTGSLMERLAPSLAAGGALFFSVLGPGVHIPPHHDATNARITCHMGLVVPKGCALKVDGEVREWSERGCLFFDSSFRHEVWNKGDANRVCLIVDLWHPELTPLERSILAELQRIIDEGTSNSKDEP